MKPTMSVKENYEFRRIYAKGRSGVSPYLVIYARPNRRGHNRLGVTASTKLGHAVVRNRVRRRLREIFRLNQDKLKQGYDFILVARTRAVGAEYRELERAFLGVCKRLGLREDKP
ncbi:ribonuclease P protein component [Oscillibacter valericigenes]|nr:ribonuclease P protein component [Oscillibacter valericigenes]